jgi:PAS domain S-box-containing protein
MRAHAHLYTDTPALIDFIAQHKLAQARGLIQLFCATDNETHVLELADTLSSKCLGFALIGSSVAPTAALQPGTMLIHFTVLPAGKVTSFYTSRLNADNGRTLALGQLEEHSKAAVIYRDEQDPEAEQFVEAFAAALQDNATSSGLIQLSLHAIGESIKDQSRFLVRDNQLHYDGICGALFHATGVDTAEAQSFSALSSSHGLAVSRDDYYRKTYNQAMHVLEQYRFALDHAALVSVTDNRGRIKYVNQRFQDISGYSQDELLGQSHNIVRHPDMPAETFKKMWRTILGRQSWRGMIKNRKKNGGFYYVNTSVTPIFGRNGEIKEFFSIRHDVTAFVMAQKRIKEHLFDNLSGLSTRTKLCRDIEEKEIQAVAVLDVKHFKLLNNYWGAEAGDTLIGQIGQAIRKLAGHLDLAPYRLDGAVFALCKDGEVSETQFIATITAFKTKLERDLRELSYASKGTGIEFSVGVGFSEASPLPYAESAVGQAKAKNAQSVQVERDNDEAKLSFYWINEIRLALEEERVQSFYQEIRSANDVDGVKKYEALIRVMLPSGEIASPGSFLDLIKRTSFYPQLTRFIVRDALQTSGHLQCVVSVNLSIQDITNDDTVADILGLLNEYGGKQLIFEITESEAITDFALVNNFLQQIREFGCKVAIDDFGSGYSNFDYLIHLKPDFIKIDGSIIEKITTHKQTLLVTQGIIDLAHKMGAEVVAEFVSNDLIHTKLVESGVDYLQGFVIHKPCPVDELRLLETSH